MEHKSLVTERQHQLEAWQNGKLAKKKENNF
jgi:hypothetical protein